MPAAAAGAVCVDKSAAFRLSRASRWSCRGHGKRALEHSGSWRTRNCCAIPLTMTLALLHGGYGKRAGRDVPVVSGAGADAVEELRGEAPDDHRLRMDWDFDGVEYDEEVKLREETRKILELPDLPVSATCVRVPGRRRSCRSGMGRDRVAARAREAERTRRGRGLRVQDVRPRRRDRSRRRLRRTHSPRPLDGERSRALRRLRQPSQGRGVNAIQIAELCASAPAFRPANRLPAAQAQGRGENASRTALRTFSRVPSSIGCKPPKEPCELDTSRSSYRAEAEVREEVAREDRAVDEEALGRRAFRDSGMRTPRARAPLSRASPIAARKSDCSTHGCASGEQVCARHEHGVVGRRPCGKVGRAGNSPAGPYCIEPRTRPSSSR